MTTNNPFGGGAANPFEDLFANSPKEQQQQQQQQPFRHLSPPPPLSQDIWERPEQHMPPQHFSAQQQAQYNTQQGAASNPFDLFDAPAGSQAHVPATAAGGFMDPFHTPSAGPVPPPPQQPQRHEQAPYMPEWRPSPYQQQPQHHDGGGGAGPYTSGNGGRGGDAFLGYHQQQPQQPQYVSAGFGVAGSNGAGGGHVELFDPFNPNAAGAFDSNWGNVNPPPKAASAGGGNHDPAPASADWTQQWSPPSPGVGDGSEDTDSDTEGDADQSIFGPQAGNDASGRGGSSGVRSGEHYDIVFERETKLGMLLERHDEWEKGSEARQERAIVKMVVDNGPAAARGVTVGSKVLTVGGEPVQGMTYQQTLELIKRAPRPLRITLVRGDTAEADFGYCLYKKSIQAPRSFKAWKRRCFVLGGAVAQPHVLQLYNSKQSYDRVVIAVFQRKRIDERVKAFKLTHSFRCSAIKSRSYAGLGGPLHYFKIKSPQLKLKQIYLASSKLQELEELRARVRRWTSDV